MLQISARRSRRQRVRLRGFPRQQAACTRRCRMLGALDLHPMRAAARAIGALAMPLRLAKLITNEKPSLVAFHTWMFSTGTRLNCTLRLRKA
jgi:hypothetical protein